MACSIRWANANGTQKIENTGPLNTKRMETVDEEFLDASLKFIDKAHRTTEAVLRVVELDPDARLYSPEEGVGREDWSGHLSRRHGRDTTGMSASCWTSSTSSVSPTTRSSCTSTDNGAEVCPGPMVG
mgnify:CR=1 FL=1